MQKRTIKCAVTLLATLMPAAAISLMALTTGPETDVQDDMAVTTTIRIEAPADIEDNDFDCTVRVDAVAYDSPVIGAKPGETESVPVFDPIVEKIVSPSETYIPEIPLSEELQLTMQDLCKRYKVPYALALAVCETESSFRTDAKNGNCIGLMQINSINFGWLREDGIEPTEHAGNIEAGVKMLGQLLDKYADADKALMAYNCGEVGAARRWERGECKSTYSQKVIEKSGEWQKVIAGYFEGGNKNA